MANIILPKAWERIGGKATSENIYYNRRDILKQMGIIGGGLLAGASLSSCNNEIVGTEIEKRNLDFTFEGMEDFYPATRNSKYFLDREQTDEYTATHYNNFYEFIHPEDPNIYNSYRYVSGFDTSDWTIEVTGKVENKGIFHLGDLIQEMGLEERTYRHRCVEAWAMAVPWTGFPFSKLIEFFKPKNDALFIRMESYGNPDQMIGVATQNWYPWPYFEGIRMDEAMNELSFIATGLYGKPMPKQNGAPVRLVTPWKYGYKSIKSIIKMEFISFQPATFWNTIAPLEYGFLSNVNPLVAHPRWSQAEERMIPDGALRPTLLYNGYGDFVADLY